MRWAKLATLHATALVSVGSLVGYVQDALDVSPYLIRRREVALVGRGNTAFNRLGETRIVIEKPRDGLLSELIDVASVTRRNRDKPGFLLGREANFHAFEVSIAALIVKTVNYFNAVDNRNRLGAPKTIPGLRSM